MTIQPAPPTPAQASDHDPELWRSRFPILSKTTYLVNHSLGAMPAGVYDKLRDYADQWATRGVRSWVEGWWDSPLEVGEQVGRLMNAPAGSVVMHQNVSIIQSIVASCLDFSGQRNKVVYSELNFPTNMYVWEGCRDRGARIVSVESPDGFGLPTERLLEAIDEETLIVPISHVLFKSSYLQDAARVCQRAREVGAMVLLDTYQSLGTVPLDVQALDIDMVCGGSVKWLCGGPGAAYLYVKPDMKPRLEPKITGWAAHAAPFAFETGAQRYSSNIERMLHGTPAVPALLAATAGYEVLAEVGVENVRRYSIKLTQGLRENMLAAGFDVSSPADPNRRGGTLTIRLKPEEDGPGFVQALAARDILVDFRPDAGVRVSPHFYTRADELDLFRDAMVELRESGKWKEFASPGQAY